MSNIFYVQALQVQVHLFEELAALREASSLKETECQKAIDVMSCLGDELVTLHRERNSGSIGQWVNR